MKSMTSSQPVSLVVLAAGIGSRYGGVKQVDPVGPNGETILDYSVYDALQAGFSHVVFVINRKISTMFRERVGRRIERHCSVSYVHQELDRLPPGFSVPPGRTKPWGTAHAVLMAREQVQAPFAAINADDFYGRAAYRLVAAHLESQLHKPDEGNHCLVGFQLDKTLSQYGYVSRGVCQVDETGYLSGVVERTRIQRRDYGIAYSEDNGSTWLPLHEKSPVSMNFWGFTPAIFEALQIGFQSFLEDAGQEVVQREYFLPAVANNLIQQGQARFKLLSTPDSWFGVTYQQDSEWVRMGIADLIAQGVYPSDLWSFA